MSEEENLPSGEEMRARYAHLMNDDESESADPSPQSTEPEPEPEATPAAEPTGEDDLPSAEDMRARYAHLMNDDAEEAPAEEAPAEPEAPAAEASEDDLPSAEDMRARYAHLMDDDGEKPAEEPAAASPTPDTQHPTPQAEPEPDAPTNSEIGEHLLDVNVRFWAELGRAKLPLAEAVSLGTGAIVDLDKEPDEAVDVYVNGTLFAKGRLLLEDGEWAVRLEEIVSSPTGVEQLSSSGSGA